MSTDGTNSEDDAEAIDGIRRIGETARRIGESMPVVETAPLAESGGAIAELLPHISTSGAGATRQPDRGFGEGPPGSIDAGMVVSRDVGGNEHSDDSPFLVVQGLATAALRMSRSCSDRIMAAGHRERPPNSDLVAPPSVDSSRPEVSSSSRAAALSRA